MNLENVKFLLNHLFVNSEDNEFTNKAIDTLKEIPCDCVMTSIKEYINIKDKMSVDEFAHYVEGIYHGIAFTAASDEPFFTQLLDDIKKEDS